MPLSAGTRLGPYEILAPIGAGGMGDVYKARDTRLDRTVAIKISHENFSDRFEREAKSIAALNHRNICQLYDVGPNYLVMELIDGAPPKGPLPVETVLDYARQITDALDAAHEKGIVHRDLKPANLKITSQGVVKVLDFGLAKTSAAAAANSDDSPTFTMATQAGMVLGTAAYMSPEQARGKPVDKRADIWAFGVVICELLTGTRPFQGETVPDVVAAVLAKEPDLEGVPDPLRSVVERCLRKDPRRRWRDIGDVRMALDEPVATRPGQTRAKVVPFALATAVALVVAAAALIGWWRAARPIAHPVQRFDVPFSSEAAIYNVPALSPDGAKIAYMGRLSDGNFGLHVRSLEEESSRPLEGTDNAQYPFFSPDGQWIAYFADGALLKISSGGGVPVRLRDAPEPRGGSWGDDGNIVLAPLPNGPLMQVPASGGTLQTVTDLKNGEYTHRWPRVLPGSDLILFSTNNNLDLPKSDIQIWSRKSHRAKTLFSGAMSPRYLSSGHLAWLHDDVLFAAPVDLGRLELTGAPVPILENVENDPLRAAASFDVSQSGILAAVTTKGNARGMGMFSLPPDGNAELLFDDFGAHVRSAPDGLRFVFDAFEGTSSKIWIFEGSVRRASLRSFPGGVPYFPVWNPDSRHLAFSAAPGKLFWARADGSGETVLLAEAPEPTVVEADSFSRDGATILFTMGSRDTDLDLWTVKLDLKDPDHPKAGKPQPLLHTPDLEREGIISPDGHFFAYYAAQPGRPGDIYVQPFPPTGAKWKISDGAWSLPSIAWARGVPELFYLGPDARIMAASYTVKEGSFYADRAHAWSEKRIDGSYTREFDVSTDGKRAIVCLPSEQKNQPPAHLTFIVNFFDELRGRAR